jgi:hypothetical protein
MGVAKDRSFFVQTMGSTLVDECTARVLRIIAAQRIAKERTILATAFARNPPNREVVPIPRFGANGRRGSKLRNTPRDLGPHPLRDCVAIHWHQCTLSANDKANLLGPLQRLLAARNRNAAPVRVSDWFAEAEKGSGGEWHLNFPNHLLDKAYRQNRPSLRLW